MGSAIETAMSTAEIYAAVYSATIARVDAAMAAKQCGRGWQGTKPPGCTRANPKGKAAPVAKTQSAQPQPVAKTAARPVAKPAPTTAAVPPQTQARVKPSVKPTATAAKRQTTQTPKQTETRALSKEEKNAMYEYTRHNFEQINQLLRKGKKSFNSEKYTESYVNKLDEQARIVKKALDVMPSVSGDFLRGITVTPDVAKKLLSAQQGMSYRDKGIMSMTTKKGIANNFAEKLEGKIAVVLHVSAKNAKNIQPHSFYGKAEGEHVLPSNTKLRFTAPSEMIKGKMHIYLEEE